MKLRKTRCVKDYSNTYWDLYCTGKLWGYQPVDMRRKYFECIHCKEKHLVKDIKNLND